MIADARTPSRRRERFARFAALVTTLAVRSLKVRYRGSFLGVLWSLSNPLLMTGVYTLIFGAAFAKYYGGSIPSYVLSVFVALAVLAYFSTTTSQALGSIVGNGALLNKIALPFSVFPVSAVTANAFQLAVGTIPLLLLVALIVTHSAVNAVCVFFPVAGLLMICTGFGLILSSLYVYFRDLPYIYEVISFVIYMTTPVFYPLDLVPSSVRRYIALNPLATIVESLRHITLSSRPLRTTDLVLPLMAGAVTMAIGGAVFLRIRRDLVDLL